MPVLMVILFGALIVADGVNTVPYDGVTVIADVE